MSPWPEAYDGIGKWLVARSSTSLTSGASARRLFGARPDNGQTRTALWWITLSIQFLLGAIRNLKPMPR